MPKKHILYTCKWCHRLKPTIKSHVIDHESYCFKNPKNKACLSCKFFKRKRRSTSGERYHLRGDYYDCSKRSLVYLRISNAIFKGEYELVIDYKNGDILQELNLFSNERATFPTSDCELHKRK